jgi:hypothetical protein
MGRLGARAAVPSVGAERLLLLDERTLPEGAAEVANAPIAELGVLAEGSAAARSSGRRVQARDGSVDAAKDVRRSSQQFIGKGYGRNLGKAHAVE